MSDFSALAGMYPLTGSEVDSDMTRGPEGAPNPMEQLRGLGANFAAADAQNKPAFQLPAGVGEVKISKRGMSFTGVDPRIFEALMDKSKKLDEIMGSFHATATQLQGKEQNASTGWGAVGNVASRLAGNLAAQPDMPGWVRGLGMTAREMNPTPEELMHQRLGVQSEEAKIGERQAAITGQIASHAAATQQKVAEARSKAQDAFIRTYEQAARVNQAVPTEEAFVAAAVGSERFTEDEARERYAAMKSTAGSVANRWENREQKKEDIKVAGGKELLKAKIEGVKDLEQKKHLYRQSEITQRLVGAEERLGKAQEFNAALKEYGASLAADKSLVNVDRQTKARLVELKGIERYANSTRDLLSLPEMQGYEGPLTPERLLPRFAQSPNLVKYNEWVNQELPRINSMVKGGVRMISSPQGRDFIKEKLGFTEHMTADQIRGILDNTDQIVKNERMSIIDGHPDKRAWKRYPELLGSAYDYAETLGGDDASPTPPKPTAGKAATAVPASSGPTNDPKFLAAIKGLPEGKAIKVGVTLYMKGKNGEPVEVK